MSEFIGNTTDEFYRAGQRKALTRPLAPAPPFRLKPHLFFMLKGDP
ncbi:MAG: hypothetical protein M3Y24_12640 [Acidobacteriota bacterium]|nr:hypothetical protein [Acidobacteriota bacterium]